MFSIFHLTLTGALTAKPYAFKIRAWELNSLESIDSNDHFNSSIYVQYKNSKIVRILPKKVKNSISILPDVSRFSFDSLKSNRPKSLNNIHIKSNKIFRNFDNKNLILSSSNLDLNSLMLFKFFEQNNNNILIRRDIFSLRSYLLFWSSFNLFKKFDTLSKICFVSSSSLSVESILLNVKIRLKYNKKQFNIFYSGFFVDSNYSLKFLSLKIKPLFSVLKSKSLVNFYFFKSFKYITFIVGESVIRRFKDLILFLNFFKQRIKTCLFYFIAKQKNYLVNQLIPLKVINNRLFSRVANIFLTDTEDSPQIFKYTRYLDHIVSFSSFNTEINKKAQYIFPVASNLESSGIYVDFEQKVKKSAKFPGIVSLKITKVFFNCFNFFKFINKILVNYSSFFKFYITTNLYRILLESLKDNKLFEDYILILNTIHTYLNFFSFATYPNKQIYVDRFRYNLSTKNSITMLNCSRNERKQSSNF